MLVSYAMYVPCCLYALNLKKRENFKFELEHLTNGIMLFLRFHFIINSAKLLRRDNFIDSHKVKWTSLVLCILFVT